MRLPFVARSTLDAVVSERDRLRQQNDDLLGHLKRVDRVEHQMTELPKEERPKLPSMPQSTRDIIQGFESHAIRRQMAEESYELARELVESNGGNPWPEVELRLLEAVAGE